jgi:hypothetical protein
MPKISALSGTSVLIFERIRIPQLLSDELPVLIRNSSNTPDPGAPNCSEIGGRQIAEVSLGNNTTSWRNATALPDTLSNEMFFAAPV